MTKLANKDRLSAFAITAPGLEPLCAAELSALGITPRVEAGGVAWMGDLASVARANLWLRTASRVIVRIAEFRAKAFFELEMNAKKIPFKGYVKPGGAAEFRVTCRKSKLYHSGAVAQRFGEALERDVKGATASASDAAAEETESDRQLFIVRFVHDVATVSVDTSGLLLHFRGYRQQLAKAPLRETLAAATLLGAGWDGTTPLVDPMCGSGTIPIEAAMIARRMAPGRDRTFAFLEWPQATTLDWKGILNEARARELPRSPVRIVGSDRDEGAIAASNGNAARADVTQDIAFTAQPISGVVPVESAGAGLVASNPPYGVRVGENDRLRNLYAQLGNVMRERFAGWQLALLSADKQLERQVGLDFGERFKTKNGGIPVHLVVAGIPAR